MGSVVISERYQIVDEIGKGLQGNVFRAYDTHLNIPVAIKKMSIKEDSINELALLKAVNHPSMVKVYDFVLEEDYAYLVMELIDGKTLKEYLKEKGALNERECILIIMQICEAIRAMHEARPAIVYRDLKPENIMITADKKIRLIDLGGGSARDHSGKSEKGVFANRAYSAPELFSGSESDEKADIYSIGMIMHEMLTSISEDAGKMNLRPPVREINPALSDDIEEVIKRCCMNNPSERFCSVRELEDALKNCNIGKHRGNGVFLAKKLLVGAGYLASLLIILLSMSSENGFTVRTFGLSCIFIGSAMLFHLWMIYLPRNRRVPLRIEKEIWLTGKTYLGLFGILLVFAGFFKMGEINAVSSELETLINENEENSVFDVEMRDEDNRKLLLKSGELLDARNGLRLEISKEALPDRETSIRVIAVTDDGQKYASREFRVKTEQ